MRNFRALQGPVTILHLTDCHFAGTAASQASWFAFAEFCEKRLEQRQVDFITLTGDISDRGNDVGYSFAETFLKRLAAMVPAGVRSIFVVPGNHDLNRVQAEYLSFSVDSLNRVLAAPSSRVMAELPFSQFKEMVKRSGASGGVFTEQVTASPRPDVEFLLLNTAWLARRSSDDHGRLSFALETWESAVGSNSRLDRPMTIALMHHGPEWLSPPELRRAERFLCKHTDLVLCGHEHEEYAKTIKVDGHSTLLVTGASIGAVDLPHHRALLISISDAGEARLHRIVRDPARTGTLDEWNLVPSLVSEQLQRVDEQEMRATTAPNISTDPIGTLREYWRILFEKDALVGFQSDRDPRDLVVMYRKLSLAHLKEENTTSADGSFWLRVRHVLEPGFLASLLERFDQFKAAVLPRDIPQIQASGAQRLTGKVDDDLATTQQAIVTAVVSSALQGVRKDGYPANLLIALLRAIIYFPEISADSELVLRSLADTTVLSEAAILTAMRKAIWLPLLIATAAWDEKITTALTPDDRDALRGFLQNAFASLVRKSLAREVAELLAAMDPVLTFRAMEWALTLRSGECNLDILKEHLPGNFPLAVLSNLSVLHAKEHLPLLQAFVQTQSDSALKYLIESTPIATVLDAFRAPLERATRVICSATTILCKAVTQDDAFSTEMRIIFGKFILRLMGMGSIDSPSIVRILPEQVVDHVRWAQGPIAAAKALRDFVLEPEALRNLVENLVDHSVRLSLNEAVNSPSLNLEEIRSGGNSAKRPSALAIVGNPGTGKTTLLRHLCMTCGTDEVPIFVSLSLWNNKASLRSCLADVLTKSGMTLEQLESAFARGDDFAKGRRLLLLLDGLDEVRDLSAEKRRELAETISRYENYGQIIITTRVSAVEWLPQQTQSLRYSLNRLSRDDVRDFLHEWFRGDTVRERTASERILSDPLLAEEVRTPFILRMFCAMNDERGTASEARWISRTAMYDAIVRYLLEERDLARGIPLKFTFRAKEAVLASIARLALVKGAASVSAEEVIGAARASVEGRDPDLAIALIREIVERSHLLVRVPPTSFDFSHYTLKEFFGVRAWDQDRAWRSWSQTEAQTHLAHESVPRFIVGHHPDERQYIVEKVRTSLARSPVLGLILATVRLEAFTAATDQEQLAEIDELIDVTAKAGVLPVDEFRAVLMQMIHRCRVRSAAVARIARRIEMIEEANQETVRLVALCAGVRETLVVSALVAVLKGKAEILRVASRRALAELGPSVAGERVRRYVEEEKDHLLLKTCLVWNAEWARYLECDLARMLDEPPIVDSDASRLGGIDVTGLSGADDALAALKAVVQSLGRRQFQSGGSDGPTDENDIVSQVERTCGASKLDEFRRACVEAGMTGRPLRLSLHPDLVQSMARALGVEVVVSPVAAGERRQGISFADIVSALTDGGDSVGVGLIVKRSGDTDLRRRGVVASALRTLLQRFERSVPADVSELCIQVVADFWSVANPGSRSDHQLDSAKARRLNNVVSECRVKPFVWEAARGVAVGLPRRPVRSDWVFLQHRFGGLLSALQASRQPFNSLNEFNVIDDDLWESVWRAKVATDSTIEGSA